MRSLLIPIALPLLLAATTPAMAQRHVHHATAAAPAPSAKRWATDVPLREGMGRIRMAVATLRHAEHRHLDPRQLSAIGSGIARDIGFIVSNCKLEPRADAALHPILGTLAQGAQALQATPADLSKVPSMRSALQDYARQFDDPAADAGDELEEAR